jgi:hypothetical protein
MDFIYSSMLAWLLANKLKRPVNKKWIHLLALKI